MPSRVIEISWGINAQEPSVRLLSKPPHEKYVALSYCWGSEQLNKATLSNIRALPEGISFSLIPKSLQDAICTSWRLGIRLLWVDSLCIIQDDHVHAAKEIALMPQIYRNAHLTISAARASSSQDGFLHELAAPSTKAMSFRLPFRCPDTELGSIVLFMEPGKIQTYDPIERRAWPLQEFLLSRRVLKYGSYQLSWSCVSEEFIDNDACGRTWWDKREEHFSALRRRFLNPEDFDARRGTLWQDVVKEYTSRNLSDPKDRLLAISGIATAFGDRFNDPYLAGLWLHDLPSALLWEIASPLEPRPPVYRAPSWSWASVDGLVIFITDLDPDPDLRLLSYSVVPAEPTAPYGTLETGFIELIGRVRQALWIENRNTLVDFETRDAADCVDLAYTRPDAKEQDHTEPMLVWCLQICPYDPL